MSNYEVVAKNYSESSENRIHSDDIAKKYGFKGALVPGVAVYGHLTHPLVSALGEAWLSHSVNNLRLLKPAYDGDRLVMSLSSPAPDQQLVECHNGQGELLATVNSEHSTSVPQEDYSALLKRAYKTPERVLIEWDSVNLDTPFVPWDYTITPSENQRYSLEVSDDQPAYTQFAHPHLLCNLANTALMNEYIMPTWLHVGTETRHHMPLRVDDTISIRSVPIEKWQNKGHEFIHVYVSLWRDGELTTEMLHTAIFKVAN